MVEVVISMGIGAVAIVLGMALLWHIARLNNNPSYVDLGWTGSIGILVWLYFFLAPELGPRQALLLLSVTLWCLRLGGVLTTRLINGQTDKRYEELSESWKERRWRNYFLFFQAQGIAAVFLSFPFALAMNCFIQLTEWDYLGVLLFLIGFSGVFWADASMSDFRQTTEDKQQVCKKGLWKYSRHPNYFFEIIIWLGFSLFAFPAPHGYIGLISPALLTLSILFLTGIPPTERHLLRTKGDAFRQYQKTTNALIPWFPKKLS